MTRIVTARRAPPLIPVVPSLKWNPGQGAQPISFLLNGDTWTKISAEALRINNLDNINNLMVTFKWAALEPTQGESDTSPAYPNGWATGAALIQSVINNLASSANFNKPKRLAIKISVGSYSWGTGANGTVPSLPNGSQTPLYLQQNVGLYGQGGYQTRDINGNLIVTQPAGLSGVWGGVNNGNTYAAMLHQPNVMARLIKTVQVLGGYFDSSTVEKIILEEDSFFIGASSTNSCPSWNAAATNLQCQKYIQQCMPSWPTTDFVFECTFHNTIADTQAFMAYMVNGGTFSDGTNTYTFPGACSPGYTDTLGDQYVYVPITFASALAQGATSATVVSWTWGSGTNPVQFSNGDVRQVTFSRGSNKVATWSGGLSSAASTSATAYQGQSEWGTEINVGGVPGNGLIGPAGGTDYRSLSRACCEVEATDMGDFGQFYGGSPPADIVNNINKTLKGTHTFVSIIPDNATGVQAGSPWTQLGPYLNSPTNALQNTARPPGR